MFLGNEPNIDILSVQMIIIVILRLAFSSARDLAWLTHEQAPGSPVSFTVKCTFVNNNYRKMIFSSVKAIF